MKNLIGIFIAAILLITSQISIAEEQKPTNIKKSIAAGKKLVKKKCAMCHDVSPKQKKKIGPPLWGVMGRDFASYEKYKYSKAFIKLKEEVEFGTDISWGCDHMDSFINNPIKTVPGTRMRFKGIKNGLDRIDIINYLKTLQSLTQN